MEQLSAPPLTLDQAIQHTTEYSKKYQIRTVLMFSGQFFVATMLLITPPLLFQNPIFKCGQNICYEDSGACSDQRTSVEVDKFHSIAWDLNLFCDPGRGLRDLGQSMVQETIFNFLVYLGNAGGLIFFNMIADNRGRKFAIQWSWLIGSLFSILVVCSSCIEIILVGLFGLGFCNLSTVYISVIFTNEISLDPFRNKSVIFLYVIWGIAEMLILPITMVIDHWRTFYIVTITIPTILLNIIPFFIQETPRYLYLKDKQQSANVLNKMAQINQQYESLTENQLADNNYLQGNNIYSCLDLFRFKSLRKDTILLILAVTCMNVQYFGSNFILARVGIDLIWNTFYIGIAETISQSISVYICPKIKRKRWSFVLSLVQSTILMTALLFTIPESCDQNHILCWEKDIQTAIVVCYRFVNSFTYSLSVVWINEIYPTTVRSIGLGFTAAFGLIGSFLSPYLVDFSYHFGVNPTATLTIFGFIMTITVLYLPETLGKPQTDQLQELDQDFVNQDKTQSEHDLHSKQSIEVQNIKLNL